MKVTMTHNPRDKYLLIDGEAAGQIRLGADIRGKVHGLAVPLNTPVEVGDSILPLRIYDSEVRPLTVNQVYGGSATIGTSRGVLDSWVAVGDANKDALDLIAAQVKEHLLWTTMEEHAVADYERQEDLEKILREGGYKKRLSFSRVIVDVEFRPPVNQERAMIAALTEPPLHALRRSVKLGVRYQVDLWHDEPGCQCPAVRTNGAQPYMRSRLVNHIMAKEGSETLQPVGVSNFQVSEASCGYCSM